MEKAANSRNNIDILFMLLSVVIVQYCNDVGESKIVAPLKAFTESFLIGSTASFSQKFEVFAKCE